MEPRELIYLIGDEALYKWEKMDGFETCERWYEPLRPEELNRLPPHILSRFHNPDFDPNDRDVMRILSYYDDNVVWKDGWYYREHNRKPEAFWGGWDRIAQIRGSMLLETDEEMRERLFSSRWYLLPDGTMNHNGDHQRWRKQLTILARDYADEDVIVASFLHWTQAVNDPEYIELGIEE